MNNDNPAHDNELHQGKNGKLLKLTKKFTNVNHSTQVKFSTSETPKEELQTINGEHDIIVIHDDSENIKSSIVKKHDTQVKFNTSDNLGASKKSNHNTLVKHDTIRYHDIIVKCNPSEGCPTTSVKYPDPPVKPIYHENCPPVKYQDTLVKYNSCEKYASQTIFLPPKLESDSSSTLSSAWDIDVEVETERRNSHANESFEIGRAPLAHFRRCLKNKELNCSQ